MKERDETVDLIEADFEEFVTMAEPRLRRGYLGTVGVDRMPDAVAEALAYGWEHWNRISTMTNTVGYLFRVGQSKTRARMRPQPPVLVPTTLPTIEPGLPGALKALPDSQRTAVWLAHGCGWSHGEIATVLEVSESTVATHVGRALKRLRSELGVEADA